MSYLLKAKLYKKFYFVKKNVSLINDYYFMPKRSKIL